MSGDGPGQYYMPYDSGSDSGSESDSDTSSSVETGLTSVSSTESTGTSTEERIVHDGRMQALDNWRMTAATWISAPGRAPVSDRLLPLRPPPVAVSTATAPTAMEVPLELRAHDVRRHIINIDTQFRESPESSTATEFYWRLLSPIRNVLRVRVTSVELPNNYYFFSRKRQYVSFALTFGLSGTETVYRVEDGNYTAGDMVDAVLAILQGVSAGFAVTFSEVTGKFTITHPTTAFSLNFNVPGESWERPFAYGLGYFMGFSQRTAYAATLVGGKYTVVSDACASFQGDNYLFLRVNDFNCVRQTVNITMPGQPAEHNDFTALAKLILREPKNYMTFDDYAADHIKEVVFTTPRDLERFHVQLVDAYGEVVDFCSAQFSFSLEVLEIQNPTLYDTIRNTLMLRYA
jgi:hypothetical protein